MTNLSEVSAFFAKLSRGAACQVMSRDLYRLCKALPLDRHVSVLAGGFGFYVMNALTMYMVYATAFILALLNLGGLLPYYTGSNAVSLTSLAMWMPLLVSTALMVPDTLLVWHEKGVRVGLAYLYGKVITLAPLYYLFIAQTRAFHFTNTMRWGGAAYYVPNRAVSVSHVPFHEIWVAYARSHFYPAAELLMLLVLAASFEAPSDLFNMVWMLWIIGIGLLYVPFLYNPHSLHLPSLCRDWKRWREWMASPSRDPSEDSSWASWWELTTPSPAAYTGSSLCGQVLMGVVYGYISFATLKWSNTSNGGAPDMYSPRSLWQLSLGVGAVAPSCVLATFDTIARPSLAAIRPILNLLLPLCAIGWFMAVTQSVTIVSFEVTQGSWAGYLAASLYAVRGPPPYAPWWPRVPRQGSRG